MLCRRVVFRFKIKLVYIKVIEVRFVDYAQSNEKKPEIENWDEALKTNEKLRVFLRSHVSLKKTRTFNKADFTSLD